MPRSHALAWYFTRRGSQDEWSRNGPILAPRGRAPCSPHYFEQMVKIAIGIENMATPATFAQGNQAPSDPAMAIPDTKQKAIITGRALRIPILSFSPPEKDPQ